MKSIRLPLSSLLIVMSLTGCNPQSTGKDLSQTPVTNDTQERAANPLLRPFSGPYQGVPAFGEAKLEDLLPAMEQAMALQLAEVDRIVANPAPATFDNTIAAMERSGKALDRVYVYYGIWRSNLSSPQFRALQAELAPKLSAFYSKISQNEGLFKRIEAVYHSDAMASLSQEQRRIVTLMYQGYTRSGATLKGEAKARYAAINQRLAELHTAFGNNVLHDEESYVLYLDESQLGGLPSSLVQAAASAAAQRGHAGKYAITNTRSSMEPFLTYSTERALREKVWNHYYNRGDNGNEHDNNAIIKEILTLRQERVQLLGYQNYAQWRLEDRMAKNPENAMALLMKVWPAAVARVNQEVADMQAVADARGDGITIAPWDYRFYAERVRQQKYDLNSNEIKQYLQLDNLTQGMFYVAGRLFGFDFTPVADHQVPVYHPDVKVWEVKDKHSGEHVGLFYLDPFARQGKRSGAWANTFRSYTDFDGPTNVLATNNANYIKGEPGKPVLISWDDAETLFHEFGHALHFLSARVSYPYSHNGVRDYTEFQSQLLERWLLTDEVINNYLLHVDTNTPMPQALINKIKRAANFNEGFRTTEYLASSIIDLKLHMTDAAKLDVDSFERETLDAIGMPKELVMRHRTPHFSHVFSSEGYASGYYGYLWAEVLTSDAAQAFESAPGGYYDQSWSKKLVEHLFSVRNALDPAEAYRRFRGRDPRVEALMKDRGFM